MDTARNSTPRSRQNSATTIPRPIPDRPSKDIPTTPSKPRPHYTVFIRLPFARNDFEDPPPVEWDAVKDKALWKVISAASSSKEIDWEEMSQRFDVSLAFLLQQAAWLYERHFDAMKAQMKRLSVVGGTSGTASPVPKSGVKLEGGSAVGGVGMSRTGSKDSNRTSLTNLPKNSPSAGELENMPGTPRSTRMTSRTPSANTVTQTRYLPDPRKSRPVSATYVDRSISEQLPRSPKPGENWTAANNGPSESESEEEASATQSQRSSRPPLGKRPPARTLSSDGDAEDDEQDSSGGYLPFAAPSKSPKEDPAATLRVSPRKQNAVPQLAPATRVLPQQQADSSASSASSAQQAKSNTNRPQVNQRAGQLSQQQRAELEKLSPRYKRSGSDGSPSMGSSFSDLDDASVTQSALEDALMSNMQYGSLGMGMGGTSRLSGLRDGLGK